MGLSRADIAAIAVTIILIGGGLLAFTLSGKPIRPSSPKAVQGIALSKTASSAARKACGGTFLALTKPRVTGRPNGTMLVERSFKVRCQDGRSLIVRYEPVMGVDIKL